MFRFSNYHSNIVEWLRSQDYRICGKNTEIVLAKEFGFCYGVDRAIEYTYQTLRKFPGKRVFLTGEIIHNPFANNRMLEMGVKFLSGKYNRGESLDDVGRDDIVVLPAFGVDTALLDNIRAKKCVMVDTTCGSVLNVWKHVERFSRDGYTAVVHGKYYHEETIATVSQTTIEGNGKYIVVRNLQETDIVCDYIRNGGDRQAFLNKFEKAVSPGFDPDTDLQKIGVANQTTMLANESIEVGNRVKKALLDRYGEEKIAEHFRAFDTICSATQERQDALLELLESGPDLTIVIGGFNSSNTCNLTNIAVQYGPAYHIEDAADLIDEKTIRHKPAGSNEEAVADNWLPSGKLRIAVTAGASTPNTKIGEVIERLFTLRGEHLSL